MALKLSWSTKTSRFILLSFQAWCFRHVFALLPSPFYYLKCRSTHVSDNIWNAQGPLLWLLPGNGLHTDGDVKVYDFTIMAKSQSSSGDRKIQDVSPETDVICLSYRPSANKEAVVINIKWDRHRKKTQDVPICAVCYSEKQLMTRKRPAVRRRTDAEKMIKW